MVANYDVNTFSFSQNNLILGGKYKLFVFANRGENKSLTLLCYCTVVLCYA